MFNFKDLYINNWYSVIGPNDTNLKNVDEVMNDYYFGEKTIENAEIKMQNNILNHLPKTDLVVGSDLLDQLLTTNLSLDNRNIPYLGVYSACASSIAGLIILGSMIQSKQIKSGTYITSSHNLTAEKQFRFPIEYGAPKPKRSTFTITGAIGINVSKEVSNIRIINGTIGTVVDSGIKDIYNIGAVMAPSAAKTLLDHLKHTKTAINDYDLILTGDLGLVGMSLFKEILKEHGILKINNYVDAGTLVYKNKQYSGASGPPVIPLILLNNMIYNKKYKKILLLATGSLHSPLLTNQQKTIPSITHALTIEVMK